MLSMTIGYSRLMGISHLRKKKVVARFDIASGPKCKSNQQSQGYQMFLVASFSTLFSLIKSTCGPEATKGIL